MTYRLSPSKSVLLLCVLIFVSLTACAPSASDAGFSLSYDGPIETVALVLEPSDDYNAQRYQDLVYDRAFTGFYEHPYARARFDVVERQRVETVLGETQLVQAGSLDQAQGPRLGELIGAQYIVFINVTNVSAEYVSGSGLQLGGVSLGGSGYRADSQVTMTMVDTETGLIVARATGAANEVVGSSVSLSGMSTNMGDEESAVQTVVPKAINDALDKLFRALVS